MRGLTCIEHERSPGFDEQWRNLSEGGLADEFSCALRPCREKGRELTDLELQVSTLDLQARGFGAQNMRRSTPLLPCSLLACTYYFEARARQK